MEETKIDYVDITIPVTKEAHEIGVYGYKVTEAIKKHKAEGKKTGEAILAGLLDTIPGVVAAAQGANKLPIEAKKDLCAFTLALVNPIIKAVFKAFEKPEVE